MRSLLTLVTSQTPSCDESGPHHVNSRRADESVLSMCPQHSQTYYIFSFGVTSEAGLVLRVGWSLMCHSPAKYKVTFSSCFSFRLSVCLLLVRGPSLSSGSKPQVSRIHLQASSQSMAALFQGPGCLPQAPFWLLTHHNPISFFLLS